MTAPEFRTIRKHAAEPGKARERLRLSKEKPFLAKLDGRENREKIIKKDKYKAEHPLGLIP